MPDNAAPLLRQLTDIQLPPPISVWPLAPGWYGVILIVLLLIGASVFWLWHYAQRRRYRQHIYQQLRTLEEKQAIMELSVLLRRIALSNYPRHEVAGLQGQAWLTFLQNTLKGKSELRFEGELGELLLTAPYQKTTQIDRRQQQALFQLATKWVSAHV